MRRRLVSMTVAVTAMVVIAFSVPLAILVRTVARNQAITDVERQANGLARTLAVVGDTTPATVGALLASLSAEEQLAVVQPDDTVIGDGVPGEDAVERAREGAAVRIREAGGEAVYVPVIGGSDGVVVRGWVGEGQLTRNVAVAWAALAGLGLFLVAVAAWLADRLGRSMVRPVEELAAATESLARGDLDVTVVPDGPPELREVGSTFNQLVARVKTLLQSEREAVAELTHRLRTPLTALRLDIEGLSGDDAAIEEVKADLAHLERTVDRLIDEARRPVRTGAGVVADLGEITRGRLAFWSPLASDQGRRVDVDLPPDPVYVALARYDLEAMVDALIGNVIAHTAEGVAFAVRLAARSGMAVLEVMDEGPGFDSADLVERGVSGAGGTGLGLDIVRKTAQAAGGTLELGSRPGSGSRVEVRMRLAA